MSDRNRKRDRARWRGEYTSSMNVTIFFRIFVFTSLVYMVVFNFTLNQILNLVVTIEWNERTTTTTTEKNDKNSISRSANNGNEYCLTTPKSKAKNFHKANTNLNSFVRFVRLFGVVCESIAIVRRYNFFFCLTSLLLFRFVHGDLHCATYWECDFKRMLTATTTAAQSKKKVVPKFTCSCLKRARCNRNLYTQVLKTVDKHTNPYL